MTQDKTLDSRCRSPDCGKGGKLPTRLHSLLPTPWYASQPLTAPGGAAQGRKWQRGSSTLKESREPQPTEPHPHSCQSWACQQPSLVWKPEKNRGSSTISRQSTHLPPGPIYTCLHSVHIGVHMGCTLREQVTHITVDLCILQVASIYTCALTCTHTCAHACTCSPIILGLQLTIEHLCHLPLPQWMQRHAEAHGLASGTRASSQCPLTPNQGPTFKTMTPYTPTKLVLICN